MRNVEICAACLATDVRMYSISPDHLLQAYVQVLRKPMRAYMPQTLCWECTAFLNRFMWFRSKCERAYRLLELLHEQHQEITGDCVKESERARHDLTSSLTCALAHSPIECVTNNNNARSQDMQDMKIKCEPRDEENGSVDAEDTKDTRLFFSVEYASQERKCVKGRLSSLTYSNTLCLSVKSEPNLSTTPIVIEECVGSVKAGSATSAAGGDLDVGYFQASFVDFATKFIENKRSEGPNGMQKNKIQRMKNSRVSSQHEPEVTIVKNEVRKDISDIILLDGDDSTPSSGGVQTDAWTQATPSLDDDACSVEGEAEVMVIEPSAISGEEETQELIPGSNTKKRRALTSENEVKNVLHTIGKGSEDTKLSKVRKKSLLEEILRCENKGADTRTLLTNEEEDRIVDWILHLSVLGFPVTEYNLTEAVLELIEPARRESFSTSAPSWYQDFLIRYPKLSTRVKQCVKTTEATEWSVKIWYNLFTKWDIVVGDLRDVFKDPRRVFHSEESAILLCPTDSPVFNVLVKKDSNKPRSHSEIVDRVTISLTISADGSMQPPLVLFPYELYVPDSIHRKMPPFWTLGASKTGWTNGTSFYNYMVNVFYPWLIANKIPLPIILFLDGRTSYVNVQLSEFCKEKGIYLTAMLPNSHRFQPLDCAVLRPLRRFWVNHMRKWRMETGKQLKQEDFCAEMDVCLKQTVTSCAIQEAFRSCGLCPLDPHNIDFVKLKACEAGS